MSETKADKILDDIKTWNPESGDWSLIFLILIFGFGYFGNSENPRINELEKKVARIEGQMSMIGGKRFE